MNKKILPATVASFILLTSFSALNLGQENTAHADTTSVGNSSFDIQSYDKYITVIGGKFVANLPSDTPVDIAAQINSTLKTTNDNLIADGNFIDPSTKEIVNEASLLESSKRPAHQVKKYYWGVKHIFRTNTAAEYQAGKWESASKRSLLASLVPGVAIVGVPAAGYADLLAHDLRTYKAAHKSSKIYMNVTNFFYYKFGIWKD